MTGACKAAALLETDIQYLSNTSSNSQEINTSAGFAGNTTVVAGESIKVPIGLQ
jgi:hypothetical protein